MKKKKIHILADCILALTLIVMPIMIHAQSSDVNSGLNQIGGQIGASGGGFFNSRDSVVTLIGKVIKLLLFVSGAVAVLFVVIGGFMYITSAGNEEQASKGRKTVTYAIVGVVITILAYVIISVVVNLVSCQGGGGFFGLGGC